MVWIRALVPRGKLPWRNAGPTSDSLPGVPLPEAEGKMARTEKNFGQFFFVCPSRQVSQLLLPVVLCVDFGLSCRVAVQRDGSGCQFWRWEDEYEEYLITHGHVDASPFSLAI